MDRRVWLLTATRAIVAASFSMVLPFLAIYLHRDRGVSTVITGAIWSVTGLLGALSQSYAGALSDRLGRKPLMVASLFFRALVLVGTGLAVMTTAPVSVVAGLCLFNGVLRAFFDPPANAFIADVTQPDTRVAAFSCNGSALTSVGPRDLPCGRYRTTTHLYFYQWSGLFPRRAVPPFYACSSTTPC